MATGVLLAIGIALRVRQYIVRTDLWLDEAMLAANMVYRSWRHLLITPLDYAQVAPPGFLQSAKLSITLFGMSEHALRLPAFLAAIAGLIVFAALSLRIMRQWETPVALLPMAFSPLLILQASEFKQYSSDLLAGLVLTCVVVKWRASGYSTRWSLIAALTAPFIVVFSDPAVLMLAGLGIALVALAMLERDRSAWRGAIIAAPAWLIAAAGLAWSSHRRINPLISEVMQNYWDTAFFPMPPTSVREALWLPWSLRGIYSEGLGLRHLIAVPLVLMVLGIYSLWRSGRRHVVLLLFGPVVVTLLAGVARLYPFRDRLVLFLVPAFALSFAAGIIFLVSRLKKWAPPAALALTVVLLEPEVFGLQIRGMDLKKEEIKPVLAHVAALRQPGDRMYVVWSAGAAVAFYGPQFGFRRDDWFASRWRNNEWDLVWKDLEQFRGAERFWVVFSHDHPPTVRDRILAHLDSLARRVPSGDYPGRDRPRIDASVFLYDWRQNGGADSVAPDRGTAAQNR